MLKYLILSLAFFIYLFFTLKFQKEILRNLILSRRQKIINSIMIWLLPFLWFLFIKALIRVDNKVMIKKERDRLQKREPSATQVSTF